MVKYREILRLHALGISMRNIAFSCKCSKTTVRQVVEKAKMKGLAWPLPEEMGDAAIRAVLYPPESRANPDKAEIDHEYLEGQLMRKGTTMTLLWREYCDDALGRGKEPFMYSAFCARHRKWAQANGKAVMHIERGPGQEMQIDWVGDTMSVLDLDTGELLKVYIFVACLPYSGMLYAEGFFDMKEEAWIEGHAHAFSFFGGVPPLLVPDNCKTGVLKHTLDELVINDQYRRMAEYYGCAIVPARPRKPRDKAAVEMGVGLIERQIIAALRDCTFTSLVQLNEVFAERLDELNERPFQKRDGSRSEVFLRQEKPVLAPLPSKPYEVITRKIATVNFNYHVSFDERWYSVPFSYIKREVEVCASKSAVWINCDGQRIATHPRLYSQRGAYSTVADHMPDEHRDYAEWSGERFRSWASKTGPSCAQVINAMLKSRKVEQQAYRSCRALLGLGQKHGKQLLEEACSKALLYSKNPSYKTVKSILGALKDTQQTDPNEGAYLRGNDYYEDIYNADDQKGN